MAAENLLSVHNLAKIGREQPLFTGVTFGLNECEKAALIGKNGTGKSTLLATVAGILQPDDGSVVFNKTAGASYLPQTPTFNPQRTIREHIFAAPLPKLMLIRDYRETCEALQNDVSTAQQRRLEILTEQMHQQNLWNYEAQIASILSVLGIHDMNRRMGELSGGMLKKVALAQVLVEDTKLLLLDEPTNHLDVATILWLQEYLAQTKRAVLMVTHDRWFLDAVCTNIYELARNRVKLYTGNYSDYLEKKATEAEIEQNTERRIESVLRFEREWLLRGPCARGTKAKARIQRDEALINRDTFQEDTGFTFHVQGKRLGGDVLSLHHIAKHFPKGTANSTAQTAAPVIQNFSYTFTKGQKIGVVGNNGSGKSTFLNICAGVLAPDEGSVHVGANTSIAYYQQNPQFPDIDMTVLDYVAEAADVMYMQNGSALSAPLFLERFGFTGRIQHSPLHSLSGGERKRLFLVRLLLSNPNFLILDEPTNDFDIFTMNILEQFLLEFNGCLLIVSHDRYFMDKVAESLFILEDDGSISGFVGKCSEYLEWKKTALAEAMPAQAKTVHNAFDSVRDSTPSSADVNKKKRRRTFKEQREFEQLESDIATWEQQKTELEAAMFSTDYNVSAKAGADYATLSRTLDAAYARWEELAELD